MVGRRRFADAGVNAGATRRRRRACSGPSMERIDCRRPRGKSSSSMPSIWVIIESAEWKRLSRKMAVTSLTLVTAYPMSVRANQWSGRGIFDGGYGIGSVETGHIEVGEGELGDELRHGDSDLVSVVSRDVRSASIAACGYGRRCCANQTSSLGGAGPASAGGETWAPNGRGQRQSGSRRLGSRRSARSPDLPLRPWRPLQRGST